MDPQRKRRAVLGATALALAGCAGVWSVSRLIMPRLAVRVAVGGDQGEAQKFMTALAPLTGEELWRMRFRYLPFADQESAARAMSEGGVDLMVARSDLARAAKGETIVIIRREAVMLFLPPDSGIEGFADLAGKAVAVPEGPLRRQNEALLDQLLGFYGIPQTGVRKIVVPAGDIGRALLKKHAAAAFVVGAVDSSSAGDTVSSISKALRGPPGMLEFAEAGAIVKKLPHFEVLEVPRGAVSTNPVIPEETVSTLGVSVRLLARGSLSKTLAGGLASVVTTRKASLVEVWPGASQIEAPDTEDRTAIPPVHPGAAAYFRGEQTSFFDRVERLAYYLGLLVSVIGSLIAWMVGRRRTASARGRNEESERRVREMLASVREIPSAGVTRRSVIAREMEEHADWALGELVAGNVDRDRYAVIESILTRGRALLASHPEKP